MLETQNSEYEALAGNAAVVNYIAPHCKCAMLQFLCFHICNCTQMPLCCSNKRNSYRFGFILETQNSA